MLPVFAAVGSTVAAIVLLSGNHLLLTAVLFAILAALMAADRAVSPLFYAVVAVGAVAAEIVCIRLGRRTWSYADKQLARTTPYWLVPAWAIAGGGVLAIHQLTQLV